MKMLTLIVHADMKQALADVLRNLPGVGGFLFTPVEGHVAQDANDASLSVRDRVVGYVPHVRVDLVLEEGTIDTVLRTLRDPTAGFRGAAEYWLSSVDRHGRV